MYKIIFLPPLTFETVYFFCPQRQEDENQDARRPSATARRSLPPR